ncbi:MAG: tripartite tricarboxylate transporter substrate binding protein [Ectothiorhodospiraceae bacterium]|nr:tripartite tricarboxylate transporter substrate binding protein [Chromatiales bacterium]MCP5155968.1 tripartite tricarboxylate transporter substrate binding protein [Ectothiorhodospiraceae bacterium]
MALRTRENRPRLRAAVRALTGWALAGTLLLTGVTAGVAAADDWPTGPIRFVVFSGVGGSADRTARAMSTFFPEALGQPVVVINKKGANNQLGANYLLAQPPDGNHVGFTAISPYIATSIIVGGAKYTLDDFAFVNGQWTDWDIIAVNKDTPYQSLPELLEAIKANPKKVRASLVFGSSGHLTTLLLLEAHGIPAENLNMVNYDGGGAARAAVAGGQVDFTIIAGEGSVGIKDFIRPLAVVRKDRAEGWDAPPVNEALSPMGIKVPIILGSMRGMVVPAKFKAQHPDRYQKLVDAYRTTLESKDVQKFLGRSGIGADWIGPEETEERVREMAAIFAKYKDVMKE